jgi:hypothetical protein
LDLFYLFLIYEYFFNIFIYASNIIFFVDDSSSSGLMENHIIEDPSRLWLFSYKWSVLLIMFISSRITNFGTVEGFINLLFIGLIFSLSKKHQATNVVSTLSSDRFDDYVEHYSHLCICDFALHNFFKWSRRTLKMGTKMPTLMI